MAEYTKIETAMAIICDLCGDLYLDDFCPEKNDSGKCGWRKYLEEDAADVEKRSDGYHTFADLYEQRLILSAALAKNNPHAWKSKRHADGGVPFGGGWFILGFDTDEGCYTYHYALKDWDLFQCKELDKGKPWDGHTSKDVRRLLSIPAADVAPVVHCCHCRSYNKPRLGWCEVHLDCENPDDFCSYGRPKEERHAEPED